MATPDAKAEGRWTAEALDWGVDKTPVETYDGMAPRLDSYEIALLMDLIEAHYGSDGDAMPVHVRHAWKALHEAYTDRG